MRQRLEEADAAGQVAFLRELCERFLVAQPDDPHVLFIHADNLTRLSLYKEAALVIDHAEKVSPPSILKWVLTKKGALSQRMGDYQKAESIFMQAHALDPTEPGLLVYAAFAAFHSGNIQRALDLATLATQCPGKPFAEAHFNLGGYLLVLKRYVEARACYERAVEIDPEYEGAQTKLEELDQLLDFMRIEKSESILQLHKPGAA